MKLNRVKIKNFRLLHDVEFFLENLTTVIVGRNNSGKTSFSEVLRRFTSDGNATFQLQDFSAECFNDFCKAFNAKNDGANLEEIRSLLPYIELRMFFQYDSETPLGPLREFIIDVDMDSTEAIVVMRFELEEGSIDRLFEGVSEAESTEVGMNDFFRQMAERVPNLYKINVWGEDPNDADNRKESTQTLVRNLLFTGFINAQRGLDDTTTSESDILAKVLEGLFKTALLETADEKERNIIGQLEDAVQTIQKGINGDFRSELQKLLPSMQALGYPGLGGPELTTETTLNVRRLLKDHTKIRYEGHGGVLLPETYNGLGMRNLIFILLRVISFYRKFRSQEQHLGVHLVFIEEPEAHLHPQMQEVFIRQIGTIVNNLNQEHEDDTEWPIQLVISTHSSHIANEARIEAIRYFLPLPANEEETIWETKIKDLRKGKEASDDYDEEFLHQYLTLTRCDLFFADKAILVEGTSERLLMPVMMKKHDEAHSTGLKLRSQYVTIMEVGGAYAHKFFDLLNFLELQTLIITDLDPVKESGGAGCLVHKATATSNACINAWFGGGPCNPNDLIEKSEEELIKGRIRLAYQCPEEQGGACGRTLEDAFLLANLDKYILRGDTPEDLAEDAHDKTAAIKKSQFALKLAIVDNEWATPKYIDDGLLWLSKEGIDRDFTTPVPSTIACSSQEATDND